MQISLGEAKNGQVVSCLHFPDGHNIFIESSYNPEQEAKNFAVAMELQPHMLYIVGSSGLEYHIRALGDCLPDSSILLIIDSQQGAYLTEQLLKQSGYKKVEQINIIRIASEDLTVIVTKATGLAFAHRLVGCKLLRWYPWETISENLLDILDTEGIRQINYKLQLNRGFWNESGMIAAFNLWGNLPYILAAPPLVKLKDCSKGKPALVVAAGPSLQKNIDLVYENQEKFLIIAAGSAGRALHKRGIRTDFIVATDPYSVMLEQLIDVINASTILVADILIPTELIKKYASQTVFYYNDLRGVSLGERFNKIVDIASLTIGESVIVPTIAFAEYIGANPIITVGLDLSYEDPNLSHFPGVEIGVNEGERLQKLLEDGSLNCVSEGWYGGKVRTTALFKSVIDTLGAMARVGTQEYINATEGGAKIANFCHKALLEILMDNNWTDNIIFIEQIRQKILNCEELSDLEGVLSIIREYGQKINTTSFSCDLPEACEQVIEFCKNDWFEWIAPAIEAMYEILVFNIKTQAEDLEKKIAEFKDFWAEVKEQTVCELQHIEDLLMDFLKKECDNGN